MAIGIGRVRGFGDLLRNRLDHHKWLATNNVLSIGDNSQPLMRGSNCNLQLLQLGYLQVSLSRRLHDSVSLTMPHHSGI